MAGGVDRILRVGLALLFLKLLGSSNALYKLFIQEWKEASVCDCRCNVRGFSPVCTKDRTVSKNGDVIERW